MKSGVPQGSTLAPLLFNMFVDDICSSIHNANYQMFADNLKINLSITNIEDFKLLQRDTDAV
jgi:hypothetical protein